MATEHTTVFPPGADSDPAYARIEPIITPQEIKDDFLFGIPLRTPSGEEMPITVIERHWRGSISSIEHDLDITLTPTEYVDKLDYRAEDYDSWFFLKLNHRPISPDPNDLKIQIQYINESTLVTMPQAWYRIYPQAGQIQMTPTSGTMGQFFISNAGVILPGLWGIKKDYPQLIKITYKGGFEQGGVPPLVNQLIGYKTAVDILNIMSDLVMGIPGLNSYGIGLDGMSQSVTKEGYFRRIAEYGAKIMSIEQKLNRYYAGIVMDTL